MAYAKCAVWIHIERDSRCAHADSYIAGGVKNIRTQGDPLRSTATTSATRRRLHGAVGKYESTAAGTNRTGDIELVGRRHGADAHVAVRLEPRRFKQRATIA